MRHAATAVKATGESVLSASLTLGDEPTELDERLARMLAKDPGELFIVDRLEIGWASPPSTTSMGFDESNGNLYPFSLADKVQLITEPSPWYVPGAGVAVGSRRRADGDAQRARPQGWRAPSRARPGGGAVHRPRGEARTGRCSSTSRTSLTHEVVGARPEPAGRELLDPHPPHRPVRRRRSRPCCSTKACSRRRTPDYPADRL